MVKVKSPKFQLQKLLHNHNLIPLFTIVLLDWMLTFVILITITFTRLALGNCIAMLLKVIRYQTGPKVLLPCSNLMVTLQVKLVLNHR